MTKFDCDVTIKSIQEDAFLVRSVGSFMSWYKPNWRVITSILTPSFAIISILYQRFDLPLSLSRTTVKKKLFAEIVSRFSSGFLANISNLSLNWLSERYKAIQLKLKRISNLHFEIDAFLYTLNVCYLLIEQPPR